MRPFRVAYARRVDCRYPHMSPNRPPRLAGFSYRGKHTYLLTICTHHHTRAFEDHSFADIAV